MECIKHPNLFGGLKFFIAGADDFLQEIIETITLLGGDVLESYNGSCTHILVHNLTMEDSLCATGRREGKKVVTTSWLRDCLDTQALVMPQKVTHFPLGGAKGIPGASKLAVCLTGYKSQDRVEIERLVRMMGASFTKTLNSATTTHLIIFDFVGEKYKMAKRHGIKMVNHQWVEDCLKAWRLLPEENYAMSGAELEAAETTATETGTSDQNLFDLYSFPLSDAVNRIPPVQKVAEAKDRPSEGLNPSRSVTSQILHPLQEGLLVPEGGNCFHEMEGSKAKPILSRGEDLVDRNVMSKALPDEQVTSGVNCKSPLLEVPSGNDVDLDALTEPMEEDEIWQSFLEPRSVERRAKQTVELNQTTLAGSQPTREEFEEGMEQACTDTDTGAPRVSTHLIDEVWKDNSRVSPVKAAADEIHSLDQRQIRIGLQEEVKSQQEPMIDCQQRSNCAQQVTDTMVGRQIVQCRSRLAMTSSKLQPMTGFSVEEDKSFTISSVNGEIKDVGGKHMLGGKGKPSLANQLEGDRVPSDVDNLSKKTGETRVVSEAIQDVGREQRVFQSASILGLDEIGVINDQHADKIADVEANGMEIVLTHRQLKDVHGKSSLERTLSPDGKAVRCLDEDRLVHEKSTPELLNDAGECSERNGLRPSLNLSAGFDANAQTDDVTRREYDEGMLQINVADKEEVAHSDVMSPSSPVQKLKGFDAQEDTKGSLKAKLFSEIAMPVSKNCQTTAKSLAAEKKMPEFFSQNTLLFNGENEHLMRESAKNTDAVVKELPIEVYAKHPEPGGATNSSEETESPRRIGVEPNNVDRSSPLHEALPVANLSTAFGKESVEPLDPCQGAGQTMGNRCESGHSDAEQDLFARDQENRTEVNIKEHAQQNSIDNFSDHFVAGRQMLSPEDVAKQSSSGHQAELFEMQDCSPNEKVQSGLGLVDDALPESKQASSLARRVRGRGQKRSRGRERGRGQGRGKVGKGQRTAVEDDGDKENQQTLGKRKTKHNPTTKGYVRTLNFDEGNRQTKAKEDNMAGTENPTAGGPVRTPLASIVGQKRPNSSMVDLYNFPDSGETSDDARIHEQMNYQQNISWPTPEQGDGIDQIARRKTEERDSKKNRLDDMSNVKGINREELNNMDLNGNEPENLARHGLESGEPTTRDEMEMENTFLQDLERVHEKAEAGNVVNVYVKRKSLLDVTNRQVSVDDQRKSANGKDAQKQTSVSGVCEQQDKANDGFGTTGNLYSVQEGAKRPEVINLRQLDCATNAALKKTQNNSQRGSKKRERADHADGSMVMKHRGIKENVSAAQRPCFALGGGTVEKEQFRTIIRSLGGRLCGEHHQWKNNASHVVLRNLRRTEKFFAGAAAGRWILKESFLEVSLSVGHFVEEEPHEWYGEGSSEDGSIHLEAPRKWRTLRQTRGCGAFEGLQVVLYGESYMPPTDTLKRAIKAGGGTVVASGPPYTRALAGGVDYAVVCKETPADDPWVLSFINNGVACVTAEYLVEYIAKPGEPLGQYSLFDTAPLAQAALALLKKRLEETNPNTNTNTEVSAPGKRVDVQKKVRDSAINLKKERRTSSQSNRKRSCKQAGTKMEKKLMKQTSPRNAQIKLEPECTPAVADPCEGQSGAESEESQELGGSCYKKYTNVQSEEEDTGCEVCGKADDPDILLLCGDDKGKGCNKGWHIYCLNPPLLGVPMDDWFCFQCRDRKEKKAEDIFSA